MVESSKQHRLKKITLRGLSVWVLAACFFLYEFFSRVYPASITKLLLQEFHLHALQISMLGSAYYLAYSVMQIPVGVMIDRWGVKRQLFYAVWICAFAIFLFAHVHSYVLLLLSRFLMGFASSFAFVSLLILAMNWFPKRHFGFFAGATQILGVIGPVLAGAPFVYLLKVTNNDWRVSLSYVAVIGVILGVMILLFLRDYPKHLVPGRRRKPIDTLNNVKKLLRNKQARWIAIYAFCNYASISLMGAIWGTYFLQAHGISHHAAASITSMIWIGLAVGSPVVGFISDRMQQFRIPLIGCALLGIVATLMITFWHSDSVVVFSIAYFVLGFAAGGQTLSFACLSNHVQPQQRATSMGFNNTAVMLGGFIVPLIVGFLIKITAHGHVPYSSQDFTLAFIVMPVLYLFALLVAWLRIQEAN